MEYSESELAEAYRANRERARAVCEAWEVVSIEANAYLDEIPDDGHR